MPSKKRNPTPANSELDILIDPAEAAKAARLRYVNDSDEPGIHREEKGQGFSYLAPDGERITDPDEIERIKKIAIPPAWTEVWISPYPDGHILATGRDVKGRKQYRYHPRYRQIRDETKFNRMLLFSQALPEIRERVENDLALPGMPREKVMAIVIRLLEMTLIRVGNAEYARDNESFGLTTLRDKHVEVTGKSIEFSFKGKGGKRHIIGIEDRRLAKLVKRSQDLAGYELFQYVGENGDIQDVRSEDVNAYLREITGEEFTAKDFRTWGGTVLAAMALSELGPCDTDTQVKKNITSAIKQVAEQLGNTPAMCHKYYVHPAIPDCYSRGELIDLMDKRLASSEQKSTGLDLEEMAVVDILQHMAEEIV